MPPMPGTTWYRPAAIPRSNARATSSGSMIRTVPAIARRLNQEGFVPPRRRGVFTVGALAPIMERLGLVGELDRDDLLDPNEWWVRTDLVRKLRARGVQLQWLTENV